MTELSTDPDTSTGTGANVGARALFLALDIDGDGAHPAAWSAVAPSAPALATEEVRSAAAAAQDAGFALLTFADGPLSPAADRHPAIRPAARPEAGTIASLVSTTTDRIGLAPTLHATLTEPFHLATRLAALDHAGHGRAAWVVGAAAGPGERASSGAQLLIPDDVRREVTDVIDVVRALWDSWEDDTIVRNVATGRYLDPGKVHLVDFEKASGTVKGPLIIPRPPQGQIVVIAPDALDVDGRADIVLIRKPALDSVAARARRARQAGVALAFVDLEFVLDAQEPAGARLARLNEAGRWPDTGALRYAGSAAGLAGLLRALTGVVDGVRLQPAVRSVDLPVVIERVLPALAAAGVRVRAPRAGDTLRTTLGLTRPVSRFARAVSPSRGPRLGRRLNA
jgi:alkanesulfonate monooxygenase SsuD/methylene tetrahydromethanopterin reductase-like flavin-dependent oxidoreductase (luciferase family)